MQHFEDDVDVSFAVFKGEVNAWNTIFKKKLDLRNAKFKKPVNFSEAEFNYILCYSTQFDSKTSFLRAKITEGDFYRTYLTDPQFVYSKINNILFSECRLKNAKFINAKMGACAPCLRSRGCGRGSRPLETSR